VRRYAPICHGLYGHLRWRLDTMPKAKPTQVIVHRVELQEKEREFLEAYATTQTIKNLAYAGTAVGATALGYLGYKVAYKFYSGDGTEPSIWNLMDNPEARENLRQEANKNGTLATILKVFTTPTLKGII
jgi:hypothetical protein